MSFTRTVVNISSPLPGLSIRMHRTIESRKGVLDEVELIEYIQNIRIIGETVIERIASFRTRGVCDRNSFRCVNNEIFC